MNSKNSKKSHHHKFNLTYNIDLRRKDKYIALSNLSIYYIWKNIKNSYKNNKCKVSARTSNEELGLYSVQPGDRIFVKGSGFLSFARNMGTNIGKNII